MTKCMFKIKMNLCRVQIKAMFYCKVKTQNFEGYVKDPLSTEDIGEMFDTTNRFLSKSNHITHV